MKISLLFVAVVLITVFSGVHAKKRGEGFFSKCRLKNFRNPDVCITPKTQDQKNRIKRDTQGSY